MFVRVQELKREQKNDIYGLFTEIVPQIDNAVNDAKNWKKILDIDNTCYRSRIWKLRTRLQVNLTGSESPEID